MLGMQAEMASVTMQAVVHETVPATRSVMAQASAVVVVAVLVVTLNEQAADNIKAAVPVGRVVGSAEMSASSGLSTATGAGARELTDET